MANFTSGRVLVQRLSDLLGDYIGGTVDSGSTTTVVDTELQDHSETDDTLPGYVLIEGDAAAAKPPAAPEGDIRLIKQSGGFAQSTGTLTVSRAFDAAPAVGDTYSVHKINPLRKLRAINRAIRELYPQYLYRAIRSEEHVVDNILWNTAFQSWTAANATQDWTVTGVTATIDRTRPFLNHFVLSTNDGGSGTIYQDKAANQIPAIDLVGKEVKFRAWVLGTAASCVRLRISEDGGSTFTDGEYITDKQEWQKITVEHTVTSSFNTSVPGNLRFLFDISDATYIAYCYAIIDPLHSQPLMSYPDVVITASGVDVPSNSFDGSPHWVYQAASEDEPLGRYYPLGNGHGPKPGHLLRMVGKNKLSEIREGLNSMDDEVEVDNQQAELIVQLARLHLVNALFSESRDAHWLEERRLATEEVESLKRNSGARMPGMSAQIPDGFRFEEAAFDDTSTSNPMNSPAQTYLVYENR